MKTLKNQLRLSLLLLKLIGGFSFSKYKEVKQVFADASAPTALPSEQEGWPAHIQPKILFYKSCDYARMMMMSVAIILVFAIYVFLTVWSLISEDETNVIKGDTYVTVDLFEDSVNMIAIILLGIYFMLKRSLAFRIVMRFHSFIQRISPTSDLRRFKYQLNLSLLVYTFGNVFCFGAILNYPSALLLSCKLNEIFEIGFNFILICFTMSFYSISIFLIHSVYDNIQGLLMRARNQGKYLHDTAEGYLSKHPKRIAAFTFRGKTFFTRNSIKKKKTDKKFFLKERQQYCQHLLKEVKTLLLDLHHFHRLLHHYLGFPIAIILLACIASFLTSTFSLYLVIKEDLFSIAPPIGFASTALVPILVLTNIPVILQKKVSAIINNCYNCTKQVM